MKEKKNSELITYNYLKSLPITYEREKVQQFLKICRKRKITEHEKNKCKVEFFKMLSKITVKNIDNFFFLTINYKKERVHDKDELVGECYIRFENCIKNYSKKKQNQDFFWYYQKALQRAMFRIASTQYEKRKNDVTLDVGKNVELYRDSRHVDTNDFTKFSLNSMNFTNSEKDVILSRLKGEKTIDFCNARKMKRTKYNEILNTVRVKYNKLMKKEDGIIN